jgi:PIN domain nuclease of toxin-antitoxin system
VNLLLDSHALMWFLFDPRRMKPEAATAIAEASGEVCFSAATVWELELKAAKGKLRLPETWLEDAEQAGFRHLPVTAREARASARLPWHHTDPFDRMLVAQAREHGLTIATRDPLLSPYGVPVVRA